MNASMGLIPFNDPAAARVRVCRDILPSLAAFPAGSFELLVVDNSTHFDRGLAELLRDACPYPFRYKWNNGQNLQYSRALNQLANLARFPYLVYTCARHGRMFDPTWIADLLRPLEEDRQVAMTGTIAPSLEYGAYGLPDDGVPRCHVQGGVFAARTDLLRRFPYPDLFPHLYSDVWIGWKLQREGYRLADVRTVCSVWRAVVDPTGRKYVHDCSEQP